MGNRPGCISSQVVYKPIAQLQAALVACAHGRVRTMCRGAGDGWVGRPLACTAYKLTQSTAPYTQPRPVARKSHDGLWQAMTNLDLRTGRLTAVPAWLSSTAAVAAARVAAAGGGAVHPCSTGAAALCACRTAAAQAWRQPHRRLHKGSMRGTAAVGLFHSCLLRRPPRIDGAAHRHIQQRPDRQLAAQGGATQCQMPTPAWLQPGSRVAAAQGWTGTSSASRSH